MAETPGCFMRPRHRHRVRWRLLLEEGGQTLFVGSLSIISAHVTEQAADAKPSLRRTERDPDHADHLQ